MLVWALYCLLLAARESVSEMVQCYSGFYEKQGSCGRLLGEVEVDDCCLNPHYGYIRNGGVCQSCRPASWTDWSPWGPCSVSCLEGVQQRRRFCYGIGICNDIQELGHLQTKPCQDSDCCPKQGGWGEWGAWQACSVSCGVGKKLRDRICSSPPPTCGGSCDGSSSDSSPCDTKTVCPVHGSWTAWGPWGTCGSSCVIEGSNLPVRQSTRSCTNPAPSTNPPGLPCPDSAIKTMPCTGLPNCPVHGGWGPWSGYGRCTVTCGVGETVRTRACDSPAPQHRGNACPGENSSTQLCNTKLHCPVDGQWSEWAAWSACTRKGKVINCKHISTGIHSRVRTCKHQDFNGKHCPGETTDVRSCYDINRCRMYGNWSEWTEWSHCKPSCGPEAQKTRTRECLLDLSSYKNLIVEPNEGTGNYLSGTPLKRCPRPDPVPQNALCLNVPACEQP